jgi:hypothetical protein
MYFVGSAVHVEGGQGLDVRVGPSDIARGILAFLHSPAELQEWALVILAGPFGLDLEVQLVGDILLDALWDASFGQAISEEAIRIVQTYVESNPH